MKKIYLFIIVALLVGGFSTQRASAQQPTSLAISPAVIEVNLKPGQIKNSKITVTNTSAIPLGVGISLNKVTPYEAQGLEVELKKPDWVRLSDTELLLKSQESREIELVTSPNRKTAPGGYYAVIYFQAAIPLNQLKTGTTTAIPKLGAFMLINVHGKSDINFTAVKTLTYPLVTNNTIPSSYFSLKNTGNVHIIPSGHVEFNRVGKPQQYRQSFTPTLILPSTTRQVDVEEISDVKPGIYKIVEVSIKDPVIGYERNQIGFMLVAGKLTNFIYALIALPFIIFGIIAIKNRKRLKKALRTLFTKDLK